MSGIDSAPDINRHVVDAGIMSANRSFSMEMATHHPLRTSASLPTLQGCQSPNRRRSSSISSLVVAPNPAAKTEQHRNTRAEIHGPPPSDLHLTIWDIFSRTASAHPEREAIVSLWQPGTDELSRGSGPANTPGCLRWTYHGLMGRVESLARLLKGLGCGPGTQLAAILWNSAEWGLFFWVAARIGMTFVPIDPRIPDDVRSMLSSLSPQVVVVQDAESASIVDLRDVKFPVQIQCSGTVLAGWMSLDKLGADRGNGALPGQAESSFGKLQEADGDSRNIALVIFTSGTTGRPKGCPHTVRNLVSETCDYDPNADRAVVDRWLVHTPVSHVFAVNNALRAWKCGDTVVLPSKAFDIGSTVRALTQEKCTIMSATPTLVKALIAHHTFPDPRELNLELVTLSGTSIGVDDMAVCRERLGAKAATQAYGMSEGAPLVSWSRTDPRLVAGHHPGVGKVLAGAKVRICGPGSRHVLLRGQVGELHVGGSSVISQYLANVDADSFYDEGSVRWLRTGDQGRMDEDGAIHILGRYKDMIIRGGENIYPTKVELALGRISGLQAHVVGVPDNFAGQILIAVIEPPAGSSKEQIFGKIRELDMRYILDEVYTLHELGLDKVPVTSLGKLKRGLLKEVVVGHREKRDLHATSEQEDSTYSLAPLSPVDTLIDIWESLAGFRPPADTPVAHFADSIMLLRFCDGVLRRTGYRLYLQDLVENNTLEKQAKFLFERDHRIARIGAATSVNGDRQHNARGSQGCRSSSFGVAQFGDHVFSSNGKDEMSITAREKLKALGLGDSKLEGLCKIKASLHRAVVGPRVQSYHVRMVFRVHGSGIEQVRRGLEVALRSRSMMRSILCHKVGSEPYHAIVEAGRQLFDRIVREVNVETEEEARECYQDDSSDAHSKPFMFSAEMIQVLDSGQTYLSMTYSHSIVDALTLLSWHADLNQLIHNPDWEVPPQTTYTMFSDLYSQFQDSIPAQDSVSFHVRRLRGISRFKQALWPLQRAPGWMVSNDKTCSHFEERERIRKKTWTGEWETRVPEFRYPRLGRVVCLPALNKLQQDHGIHPAIYAKCALIIFNVLQTGSSHAVFSTWESGRSWPFVPQWMQPMLPPAMSIDGPTAQWILGMFEVISGESILTFFRRQTDEIEQMKYHEHAPWQKVVDELRDEGAVVVDASFRQSFVWDVSVGLTASQGYRNDMKALEPVARYDWPDCGFFWNAFMVDRDNLYFIASWDTAQLNAMEVEAHCDCLADVMRKMADEGRWGETIGEVFNI